THFLFFFFTTPRQPTPTLFPYTTLFRSIRSMLAGGTGIALSSLSSNAIVRVTDPWALIGDDDPWSQASQILARIKAPVFPARDRSEEHTSDSSHLVISYAVFCLKKKKI